MKVHRALCLAVALAVTWSRTVAYFSFQVKLPNGDNVEHPCKDNYRWGGLGHKNPLGGGDTNVFGDDFMSAGFQWTEALCKMDSDGDGKSNGEELGDPDCKWVAGELPPITRGITNPGICEPVDSDLCLKASAFVSCELEGFEKCERIKQPDTINRTLRFIPTTLLPVETIYYCMDFDLPHDQEYHLVAIEPVLDNLEVIHHMLLHGCVDGYHKPFKVPGACGMAEGVTGACPSIIGIWTVGSSGRCLNDLTGFRVGLNSYKSAMLQIHWNNPYMRPDHVDSSGLKVYFQPRKSNVKDLATLVLGQTIIDIPPGQENVAEDGSCSKQCLGLILNQPIHVISNLNHMHYLGRREGVRVYRNGTKIAEIGMEHAYSYDSPMENLIEPPMIIQPGDSLVATCIYNSRSSKNYVYYGDATADEMCFAFFSVYPAQAFNGYRVCVGIGPLSTCDFATKRHVDGCDWTEFMDLGSKTMKPIKEAVDRSCNLDGFCRPECYQIFKSLSRHPCMNGDIFKVIVEQLDSHHEGLQFLTKFNSCKGYTPPAVVEPPTCNRETCGCA